MVDHLIPFGCWPQTDTAIPSAIVREGPGQPPKSVPGTKCSSCATSPILKWDSASPSPVALGLCLFLTGKEGFWWHCQPWASYLISLSHRFFLGSGTTSLQGWASYLISLSHRFLLGSGNTSLQGYEGNKGVQCKAHSKFSTGYQTLTLPDPFKSRLFIVWP